jgi:hypothetical protein
MITVRGVEQDIYMYNSVGEMVMYADKVSAGQQNDIGGLPAGMYTVVSEGKFKKIMIK